MKDLQKKKDADLLTMLAEKKETLRSMNFSFAKAKPGEQTIGNTKKDIARILTEINRRKNQQD